MKIQLCRTGSPQVALFCLLLLLLLSSGSQAQHEMHNAAAGAAVKVVTMPQSDEVLAAAPASIMLHFENEVVLAGLTLREPSHGKEIIDIGFRYRPQAGRHFEQPLPELARADYYLAEWAVIDASGKLEKGAFYFSFGKDAKPPSFYRGQLQHSMPVLSPDYRLQ